MYMLEGHVKRNALHTEEILQQPYSYERLIYHYQMSIVTANKSLPVTVA